MSPRKSGAHIALLQNSAGTLQRIYNSAGRTSKFPKFRGAKIDGKFAPQSFRALEVRPQNYGSFEVRPAVFWSNATCAPLSHGNIVKGAKIPTKIT